MSASPRFSLADLGELKRRIDRERREAAERAQREREARLKAERERHLFRLSVGDITPLSDQGKVLLQPPPPEPIPRQRELDEQAALEEALSDEMDVERLLETDEGLSFRRRHSGQDVVRRLRRGQWTIQAQIDLHGLRRDEARESLQAFLRLSRRLGHRCVRVVHGKGLGSPGKAPVLKSRVRAWLIQSWTGCVPLRFLRPKARRFEAGACQSSTGRC